MNAKISSAQSRMSEESYCYLAAGCLQVSAEQRAGAAALAEARAIMDETASGECVSLAFLRPMDHSRGDWRPDHCIECEAGLAAIDALAAFVSDERPEADASEKACFLMYQPKPQYRY